MLSNFRSRMRSERGDTGDGAFIGLICCGVLAVLFLLVGLIGTTYEGTPPDKIGLHYTGGPFDGTHYVGVIQPGSGKQLLGLSENLYLLPARQRNYIISKTTNEGDRTGADFITAPSGHAEGEKPVSFTLEASIYFMLNQDPQVIREFFEQVCLHDKCWTDKGWDAMLDQFFRKPLELAVAQETKKYLPDDLYSNPDTLVKINKEISQSLADDINATLGGKFFCGPNSNTKGGKTSCTDFKVIIKNPTPPKSVTDAYDATFAQKQLIAKTQAEAQQAKAEADGKANAARAKAEGDRDAQNTRASAKTLTQEQLDYIRAQALATCAANNNCTLIFSPSGSGVNVNTGG